MNRILIVEDELRIASFLEKGLRKNGFHTAIATDGEQALEMVADNPYDLLLLDIGLPIKDGWTVLAELRQQGENLPVIIVSAKEEEKKSHLANDYVKKPFSFEELLQRIRNYLPRVA
jgi:two-component system, OmpR family, copper resistance phosphate regulon response regulator CusR